MLLPVQTLVSLSELEPQLCHPGHAGAWWPFALRVSVSPVSETGPRRVLWRWPLPIPQTGAPMMGF